LKLSRFFCSVFGFCALFLFFSLSKPKLAASHPSTFSMILSFLGVAVLVAALLLLIFLGAKSFSYRKCVSCRSFALIENNRKSCPKCRKGSPLPLFQPPSLRKIAPGPPGQPWKPPPPIVKQTLRLKTKPILPKGNFCPDVPEEAKSVRYLSSREKASTNISERSGCPPPKKKKRKIDEGKEMKLFTTTTDAISELVAFFSCPSCRSSKMEVKTSEDLEGGDCRLTFGCMKCDFFFCWDNSNVKTGSSPSKKRRWLPTFFAVNYLVSGGYYHDYQKMHNNVQPGMSEQSFLNLVKTCSREMEEFTQEELGKKRAQLKKEGKNLGWACSADGFYHIRGHHSDNASAAIYDVESGDVVFAQHGSKKGGAEKKGNYTGNSRKTLVQRNLYSYPFFFSFPLSSSFPSFLRFPLRIFSSNGRNPNGEVISRS